MSQCIGPLRKSRAAWREGLPPDRYAGLFEEATERLGSSRLNRKERAASPPAPHAVARSSHRRQKSIAGLEPSGGRPAPGTHPIALHWVSLSGLAGCAYFGNVLGATRKSMAAACIRDTGLSP